MRGALSQNLAIQSVIPITAARGAPVYDAFVVTSGAA
jgi:hypothetical protein